MAKFFLYQNFRDWNKIAQFYCFFFLPAYKQGCRTKGLHMLAAHQARKALSRNVGFLIKQDTLCTHY